jgi:thioredoxin reductase (NADPH)
MSSTGDLHRVRLEGCEVIAAWSVIIATGARYNRLALARLAEFESVGVYYAATQTEAQACSGGPAVIVGGGNSAGQAALFLARACTQVLLATRGETLAVSMSRYLIDEIERHPRITVSSHTEVIGFAGDERLEGSCFATTARARPSGNHAVSSSSLARHRVPSGWTGNLQPTKTVSCSPETRSPQTRSSALGSLRCC